MQQSNRPPKFLAPFAQGDTGRTEVPLTSPDSTRASQTLGFPPLTGTPPEAGGVPPQREDMNGALNQATRLPWWLALGGRYPYDAAFANDAVINGYPQFAVLPATASAGEWYSLTDNNLTDPEAGGNWVPGYHYGATVLAAQTGGGVTLTQDQAAKRLLIIEGTLTANLTITVPAWVYAWDVINNTGGAYTVALKYPTSGSVTIAQTGAAVRVVGDGTALQVATQIVPPATTSAAGIQRNATNGEAAAGTLTNVTITPASMASAALLKSQNLAGIANAGAARTNLGLGAVATWDSIGISNVTGLQTALDAKLNVNNPTATGTMAGVSGYQFDGGMGYIYRSGDGLAVRYGTAATNRFAFFEANGDLRVSSGAMLASGGFQNASSRTVKHHIAELDPAECLASVLSLQGVRYRYVWDDTVRLGYYAEDTRELIPEAVHERAVHDDGTNQSPLTIEDAQLLPHHTGAIQALHDMITKLEARVAELEAHQ